MSKSTKVSNPNAKGGSGFLWAILAVVVIAAVVIGYIVISGQGKKTEHLAEREYVNVGFEGDYSDNAMTLRAENAGADAEVVDLYEDYSCPYCSTLALETGYSVPYVMQQVGHPNDSILPAGLNPAEARNGTGPFTEIEYVPGDHYTVAANPDYWGEAPGVSEITFQFYPDPTARLLALQAGDVDMITDVPRQAASQVEAAGASLITGPVGAYEAMYIQIHGAEPYDLGQDPAVREAISIAIDRQQIIDNAWQGNAEPGTTMIPPAILGDFADLVDVPQTDPDAAKAALEAARVRQMKERLELGPDYGSGEAVVSNEAGEPYNPAVLSRYWREFAERAGVRALRLHDCRHTAATTLHLQGVPVAVIAAWIGHSNAAFTMQVYAHSQNDALKDAASVLGSVVTSL